MEGGGDPLWGQSPTDGVSGEQALGLGTPNGLEIITKAVLTPDCSEPSGGPRLPLRVGWGGGANLAGHRGTWWPCVVLHHGAGQSWGCRASCLRPRGKAKGQGLTAPTWRGPYSACSEAPLHPAQSPVPRPPCSLDQAGLRALIQRGGGALLFAQGCGSLRPGLPLLLPTHGCCPFTCRRPLPAPRDPVLNPEPR